MGSKQKYKINKKYKMRRLFIAAVVILLLAATIAIIFFILNYYRNTDTGRHTVTSKNTVNYDPPTKDEKTAADPIKVADPPSSNTPGGTNQSTQTKEVSVIITDATQYEDVVEIRAFIPSYLEDGTCEISLTQGGNKVFKQTPAYSDATTTICTNPLINRSEFATTGGWNLQVTYLSKNAKGISAIQKVTIK